MCGACVNWQYTKSWIFLPFYSKLPDALQRFPGHPLPLVKR